MAYTNGTAANYKDLLAILTTFAAANGWTVLTQSATEVYLRGSGPSGLDKIYVGVKAYEDSTVGYYNWELFGSVLWKSTFPIDAQPLNNKDNWSTLCTFWNQQIPYWMIASAKRIILFAKVSSVYTSVHLGFIDPAGTPEQYPYPLFIGGTDSTLTNPYSSTSQGAWWAGSSPAPGRLYLPGGTWGRANYGNGGINASYYELDFPVITRPDLTIYGPYQGVRANLLTAPGDEYLLEPIFIKDLRRSAIYGSVDGVFRVTGHKNASENIITVAGVNYICFQDVHRVGYGDYCAMRMS